jgi:meso-butanediol dehydrogenase/(S,S)-butanediol dehydrogenase/diacetyl reductase
MRACKQITGAGNGIGRATALLFAAEGCKIGVVDRDVAAGEAVVAAIQSKGGEATFVECDVSSEQSINAAVEAVVQALGGLNILVNVAGVNIMATVTDTEIERWDRAQHVNLRSVFLSSKAALPHLMAGGPSSIVNTSSVQATRGVPNFPSYAASKAGMQGLTRQMAVDYAQHAVRINCVSPGGIETGLNANSQLLEQEFLPKTASPVRNQMDRDPADPKAIELDYDPTPRLFVQGLPIDVAYTILFLASEESVHITGQNMMVDGGSSIAANVGNVPGISR